MTRRDPSPWFVFAVLFLVYIGWGSSYIGYKLSLEVAGPFLVAGGRAFIGGLLLAFMLLASGKWVRPSWKTIRWNLVVGIPFVLFGSGFIGFGQTQVSSSTAAVITSTTPILMLVAGYLFAGEPRPAFLQWVGLIAGSAGITYIGWCERSSAQGEYPVIGMILVLLAAVGWVFASLFMKKHPVGQALSVLQATSLLLVCGGADCFILAFILGEPFAMHWENLRPDIIIAFSWMTIGGTLVAYSCYIWLLTHVSIALAVSYEYVVPVVGIILGWYVGGEHITPGILMACRVLAVGNNTMTVEACGVDTEIYARNVSWQWFSDITDLYATGDLVVARVMDVGYNPEREVYSVSLSIKEASENPDRAALEKIVPNSNYFGVVTGVKDRVFFVRLQAGVNAKTKLYRSIDMPSRLDTVSFRVTGVDEESGIALGFITRIIKRHTRLR